RVEKPGCGQPGSAHLLPGGLRSKIESATNVARMHREYPALSDAPAFSLPIGESSAQSAATGAPIIQLRGITKHYGDKQVLCGIDLDVPAGQVLGYLGPNGAGKSTTVKIMIGM